MRALADTVTRTLYGSQFRYKEIEYVFAPRVCTLRSFKAPKRACVRFHGTDNFEAGQPQQEPLTEDREPFRMPSARTRSDANASTHKKGVGRHADASDEANADR